MTTKTLVAYSVATEKGKAHWHRLGRAFQNKDQGFTLLLNAMPPSENGLFRIVLRPQKPAAERTPAG